VDKRGVVRPHMKARYEDFKKAAAAGAVYADPPCGRSLARARTSC